MNESALCTWFWTWLDRILMIWGAGAVTYTAWSWARYAREEKRLSQPVTILLVEADGGKVVYELRYRPPRRMLTRAEVLGFLGMIPCRQQRFVIQFLATRTFFERLDRVHNGKHDTFVIELLPDEAEQFDLAQLSDVERS